jgi:Protein of unknown function (DUF2934)
MPKRGNGSTLAARKPQAVKSAPTQEEIAFRAYQIYLERGGTPGHELDDWTRAERELTQRNGKSGRKAGLKPIAA